MNLGKIVLIANPAAQNGAGMKHAQNVYEKLRKRLGESVVALVATARPGHAAELAEQVGSSYDTVLALGGDGLIHEVVNGLMKLPERKCPRLGVIPAGSGNDYAASLGMSFKVDEAVQQLFEAEEKAVDVGICNGEFYTETLSFGLDAAIAIDTMERRKRTGKKGTRLYLEAGLNQLMNHLDTHSFELEYIDAEGKIHVEAGKSHIFAVQNGPTYGGGFRVCPNAKLDDGLLDVCIAHAPLSVPKATGIFLLAKDGRHTGFKCIQTFQARSLIVRFDSQPPTQIDGEIFSREEYFIGVKPRALRVLFAK